LIDLDKFKAINDNFGHVAGDLALRQLSEVLSEAVRRSDTVFRYGGEEFLVLLPETDLEGAIALGEKIREGAASRRFGEGTRTFPLTLSAGASSLRDDEAGDEMISRADIALYHAKEQGRNRVEFAVG
jgi:diguanylate cyclase (GGDEF)-like protein